MSNGEMKWQKGERIKVKEWHEEEEEEVRNKRSMYTRTKNRNFIVITSSRVEMKSVYCVC